MVRSICGKPRMERYTLWVQTDLIRGRQTRRAGITCRISMKQQIWSWVLLAALPGAVIAQPLPSFDEAVAFDGTTGFIKTRPACVPPKYTPDPLNYLQGPEPIQLANGDVTLLVGTGRCCFGSKHWEGIFSLNYPAPGRFASPRFRPLWATNDFTRQPSRKEAELGLPSALFYGRK